MNIYSCSSIFSYVLPWRSIINVLCIKHLLRNETTEVIELFHYIITIIGAYQLDQREETNNTRRKDFMQDNRAYKQDCIFPSIVDMFSTLSIWRSVSSDVRRVGDVWRDIRTKLLGSMRLRSTVSLFSFTLLLLSSEFNDTPHRLSHLAQFLARRWLHTDVSSLLAVPLTELQLIN